MIIIEKVAHIGEIWIAFIPRLSVSELDETIQVILEKRPCLIVNDGRGFLIEENCDYSAMKITTKNKKLKNVNRKEIKNWQEIGLRKKSYVRVELPIKIETQQLIKKIGKVNDDELLVYLKELANHFNRDMLDKLLKVTSLEEVA